MMKPPEATAPKIAPPTEVIKKEAKFKERPKLKKAETIFREMEKMRGCPQHGKVYYYANESSDFLYIWERGIFTLIKYKEKSFQYLQPESSVVSNPFNMELTYKDRY